MRWMGLGIAGLAVVAAVFYGGVVVGRRSHPTESTQPLLAGSATSAEQRDSAVRRPRQVRNVCYVFPPKHGASMGEGNSVIVDALLDGIYGSKFDQIYLFGKCTYWWGDEPNFGAGERAHSWNCDFKTYDIDWPPRERENDIRGNPLLEGWYGARPQPIVGEKGSDHPLRIDDLEIQGPGTFSIDCSAGHIEEFPSSPLGSTCTISWYNKYRPAEFHFEGRCGTDATVREGDEVVK